MAIMNDMFGKIGAIEFEAKLKLHKAGLDPTLVKVIHNTNAGHSLVLAVQADGLLAYASISDRYLELSESDFSAQCLEPAVHACITKLSELAKT